MASLLLLIVTATASTDGSLVFTDVQSKNLLRVDAAGGTPHVIARDMAIYGGLRPWKQGLMLAATTSHKVVQINPWCNSSSCGATSIVDVPKAIGAETVSDHFALGGITLCGDDALFVAYGGNATDGHSGVLRCERCAPGTDCTSKCAVVDGGKAPGAGMHQLGGYAAGVECVGDVVLVADNNNHRVQSIPASCSRSPCSVSTYASKLDYPLGIAKVGDTILVTLDETIVSLSPDGSQHLWSKRGDCGYLVQAEDSVLVASRDVISFDASCRGPDCKPAVVWNATGGIAVYSAVAHITR